MKPPAPTANGCHCPSIRSTAANACPGEYSSRLAAEDRRERNHRRVSMRELPRPSIDEKLLWVSIGDLKNRGSRPIAKDETSHPPMKSRRAAYADQTSALVSARQTGRKTRIHAGGGKWCRGVDILDSELPECVRDRGESPVNLIFSVLIPISWRNCSNFATSQRKALHEH